MNFNFDRQQKYDINDLLKIMSLLRGEGGCSWDRAQDHHSIRNNLVEEAYEAVEAIDLEDSQLLQEELGDVLLQIVFHSQLESEAEHFSFQDVCDGICRKLIFRHPHVFSEQQSPDPSDALHRWDEMKQKEKQYSCAAQKLEAVAKSLPSLMRTQKLVSRAKNAGALPNEMEIIPLLRHQLDLLENTKGLPQDEKNYVWGKLLFLAAYAAAGQGVAAEESLYRENDHFIHCFAVLERLAMERFGGFTSCDAETLNILWLEAENKVLSGY